MLTRGYPLTSAAEEHNVLPNIQGPARWAQYVVALLLWFVVFGYAGSAQAASSGVPSATTSAVVTLHSPARVTGKDILLGQIAEIATEDESLRTRLDMLAVGKAPLAGETRSLFVGSIRVRLRQAGIAESQVQLVAPGGEVVVQAAGAVVPALELLQAAERLAKESVASQVGVAGVTPVTVTCSPTIQDVPVNSGSYEIRQAGAVAYAPLSDQVTVPLGVWTGGRMAQQVTARCAVVVEGEVAVLARKMDRYETIGESDIRWERRNLVAQPGGAIFRNADLNVVGMRLIRPQEPGVVVTRDMVELQPDTRAEAEVELIVTVGSIQVTDMGRLTKDARVGERVTVKNLRTGKLVNGVLVSPQQVVVDAQ